MRTTLDLDQDVLNAVKELAEMKRQTAGRVASDLLRRALTPKRTYKVRNGVPIIQAKPGQHILTMEMVNRARDEE